jgi:hypothetical protein
LRQYTDTQVDIVLYKAGKSAYGADGAPGADDPLVVTSGSQWDSIGGFIEGGESIAWCGNLASNTVTGRYVYTAIQVFFIKKK